MSNNKVNNKLDFRNVKTTQFDPGQVNKMSFSELQSALRVYGTNAILKDAYTHFVQDLDGNSNPISVTYYQATHPARDRLSFASDSGGSLAGAYLTLQEFITKEVYVFYYVVSGVGTAPGVGDVEIPVVINANDTSALVAYSTREAIKGTEEFIVIDSNLLANYVDVEYLQFGETDLINVGTTGFLSNRVNSGESFQVGHIDIEYDVNNEPIYNGNLLKGLKFNPFTASFDIAPGNTVIADDEGHKLDINPDGSINTVPKKDYDNFQIIARDSFGNITQVEYYLSAALVKTVDLVYDSEGCLVSYTES
jgi:hypothetical protein